MSNKKKQSKFALKGPGYTYSKHLRDWERAIKTGDEKGALEASLEHARQFGYTRRCSKRNGNGGS